MTGPVNGPGKGRSGFTLVELLTVVAVLGILSAVAVPVFKASYEKSCLMAAISEITGMVREAKQNALCNGVYYAISFNPATKKVSLLSGRGPDGDWNTADDEVVRSFLLTDKGGGLKFGYGSYGPLEDLAEAPDGVSFPNSNTLICNPELTGNGGTVYLITGSGVAMAIGMNSTDYGYKLWRWGGKKWVRI